MESDSSFDSHQYQLRIGCELFFRVATYETRNAIAMVGAIYGNSSDEETKLNVAEWCHGIAVKLPRDKRPIYYCSPEGKVYALLVKSDEDVDFRLKKGMTPTKLMGILFQ